LPSESKYWPWLIVAAVVIFFMMRVKASALTTDELPGNQQQFRINQLADAISRIEGGSPSNPGNIRNLSTGAIAESASLTGRLSDIFLAGKSAYYSADMSFRALAWTWVCGPMAWNGGNVKPDLCDKRDNPENWAAFVAGALGVEVDSAVGDFINS
jgi:hypothetical protein